MIYLNGLNRHGRVYEKDGVLHLTVPERLPFLGDDSWYPHECSGNETVLHLAVQYYKDIFEDPVSLFPIIAQAQPYPILDPLQKLPKGKVVFIPPEDYIHEVAYGDSLSDTPSL